MRQLFPRQLLRNALVLQRLPERLMLKEVEVMQALRVPVLLMSWDRARGGGGVLDEAGEAGLVPVF